MSQFVCQFTLDRFGFIDKKVGSGWSRTGAFASKGASPNNPNTDRWAWDTTDTFPSVGFRFVDATPETTSWDAYQPRGSFDTSTTITPASVSTGDKVFTIFINNETEACGWILLKSGADTPIWYGNPDWSGFPGSGLFPLDATHKAHFVPDGTLPDAAYGLS